MLRAVAAIGREAPATLLAAALGLPQPAVVEALREAVEHHLLVPDGCCATYRVRHALVAEAAYATLLPDERKALHERIATVLTEDPALASSRCAVAAELAEHWIAADRPIEALTASLRAARDAEAVSGLSEALRHLERVLDLWDQVPRAEQTAGLALPTVLDWAAELAGVVRRRCDRTLDARSLAALLDHTGETADAATVAERMDLSVDAATETLESLARGGLLERAPDGTYRAARLAVTEARELYPLAVVLESLAVRQSPPFDGPALDALRRANDRLRGAARDPYEAIVADDEFHVALTSRCGDPRLLGTLRPVKRALLRYEQVYMLEPLRIARSVADHEAIIEALERADHAAAAQRLRSNLTSGLPDLAAALEA